MELFGSFWISVGAFLVVLTILVFVHEWGHYWVARRCGVRVEVFSVGFGPEIKGWNDAHGTRWKLSAVPLGGYVKMFGESETVTEGEDERPMTPKEEAVSFHHKSLLQRSAIVFAGPGINFLFAIILFAGLFSIGGEPRPLAVVGEVVAGSAAERAGFAVEDRIVRVNDKAIEFFSELQAVIVPSAGVSLRVGIVRGGKEQTLTVTPSRVKITSSAGEVTEVGRLGVQLHREHVKYVRQNPFVAVYLGAERSFGLSVLIFRHVSEIITGQRSAKDLGGPLRIAQISGQVVELGVFTFINFMAVLSVNLGLINLFPIPMLDGGHLALYAVEAVRGRPLGPRAQEYGFRLGLALVIALFVFVTWNDLVQMKFFEFITDLFT